ncbi:hypothetical protein L7F22_047286 [Adiantum nelumboides]|nr:hypothetical protein [Adiantum nelumboides]
MAEMIAGAVAGTAFNDLYAVVKTAVSSRIWCQRHCLDLQNDLRDFTQKLKNGRKLVDSCLNLRGPGWAKFFRRLRYGPESIKLRKDIQIHLHQLAGRNTLQLQLLNEQQGKNHEEIISLLKSAGSTAAALPADPTTFLLGLDSHIEQVTS